jgi:hypothetical protein
MRIHLPMLGPAPPASSSRRRDRRLRRSGSARVFRWRSRPAGGLAAPQVVNLAAKLLAAYPRLGAAEVKKLILDGADAKDVSGGRSIRLLNEARSFELARAP